MERTRTTAGRGTSRRSYRTASCAAIAAIAVLAVVTAGLVWDSRRGSVQESYEPVESAPLAPESSGRIPVERGPDGVVRAYLVGDELVQGSFATSESSGFGSVIGSDIESMGPAQVSVTSITEVLDGQNFAPSEGTDGSNVVFIALGTADAHAGIAIDPFSRAYGAILDSIQLRSPDAVFVCAGTWNPASTGHAFDYAIETQCAARGGRFRTLVDLYDTSSNRGPAGVPVVGGVSDETNPNDEGHRAIANRLMTAVEIPSP